MKNIIKFILILFISLWIPITSSSQSIVPITKDSLILITPEELKITNLIFNEHKMLKEERPFLLKQINGLEELNKSYVLQDSLRIVELETWKNQAYLFEKENVKLSKKLKDYKKIPYISGGIIAVLLGLIMIR